MVIDVPRSLALVDSGVWRRIGHVEKSPADPEERNGGRKQNEQGKCSNDDCPGDRFTFYCRVRDEGICPAGHHAHRQEGGSSRSKLDRKSTRLNSSHLGISYAVFCLKKKKIIKKITSYK